jgi:vacuolar-type H+-ATPase subunit H
MEDLLKNIKETESEAKNIVKKAEIEASEIVEKVRSESAKKFEDTKKEIHSKYTKQKDTEIKEARIKKENSVTEKVADFEKKLGKIEDRKKEAEKYLSKIISEKFLK